MSDVWRPGQRVNVFMDLGNGNHAVQAGEIRRISGVGPSEAPERTVQVRFDDPLLMGGTGLGWVAPDQLTTAQ